MFIRILLSMVVLGVCVESFSLNEYAKLIEGLKEKYQDLTFINPCGW